MKGVETQDLHAGGETHIERVCRIGDEEEVLGVDGGEIWLDNEQEDLLDMSGSNSIFYNDFPPLPDFPCMSSSSSSSSIPAPVKAMTCSSSSSASSAASWAVLKSDEEEDAVVNKHSRSSNNNKKEQNHDNYNSGVEEAAAPAALSSTASMEIPEVGDQGLDCMDMMETFGYMELLEGNELIDPYSIFQNESPFEDFHLDQEEQQQQQSHQHQQQHANYQQQQQQQQQAQPVGVDDQEEEEEVVEMGEDAAAAAKEEGDDMATVFLEWLRSNRETVSAEDLRSVKLKKSTIECAARRLGGGKEAMKQLLKLVLEWVQTNHLQKRRTTATTQKENLTPAVATPVPPLLISNNHHQYHQQQDPNFQNPNLIPSNYNPQAPWTSHSGPYDPQNVVVAPPPPPQAAGYPSPSPMVGYMGTEPCFVNNGGGSTMNVPHHHHHPHYTAAAPPEYHQMLEPSQTWPPSQFSMPSHYNTCPFPDTAAATNTNNLQPQAFSGYGNQYAAAYPYNYHGNNGGDQRLIRLGSSATKEARKKRMARQRRLLSHHRHHNHSHHHNTSSSQQSQNAGDHHHHHPQHHASGLGNTDTCTMPAGSWVYWPSASAGGAIPSASPSIIQGIPAEPPALRSQLHNYQGRIPSDHNRKQQVGL